MKTLQLILTIIILGFIGYVIHLVLLPIPPAWTGFGETKIDALNVPAKTLWEWLELLIIPVVIGLFGWLFSQTEKTRIKKREEERAQNETFESFLETMTNLIVEYDLHDKPTRQILAIARARINVAFDNLKFSRKGQVLQFLYESYLIDIDPIIVLRGANIRDAHLDEIVLGQSEIKGAYFNNASIKKSNLIDAILIGCDFSKADLSNSLVKNTDFSYSNLSFSKLKKMDLTSVNFEGADLTGGNLRGSKINKSQLDGIQKKDNIKTTKKHIL